MSQKVYTSKFSGQEVDQKLEKIAGPILQVPSEGNLVGTVNFKLSDTTFNLTLNGEGYYCFRLIDSDDNQYATDIFINIVNGALCYSNPILDFVNEETFFLDMIIERDSSGVEISPYALHSGVLSNGNYILKAYKIG